MGSKMLKWNCLPEELCREILSYLPVKSLLRFRSVSKEWKSTISESQFAFLHLRRSHTNNHELILFDSDAEVHNVIPDAMFFDRCTLIEHSSYQNTNKFDIPKPPEVANIKNSVIHGNMDGVFLVQTKTDDFFLWNPSIKKIVRIPLPVPSFTLQQWLEPCGPRRYHDQDLYLGFDPSTNDYKVVNMVRQSYTQRSLEVFSLNSPSWKKGSTFPFKTGMIYGCGNKLSLGGSVYWVGGLRRRHQRKFVSLNMTSETLSSISLPDFSAYQDREYNRATIDAVAVAGTLVGLLTSFLDIIDVWVLMNGCSWTKTYSFPNRSMMDLYKYSSTAFYLTKDDVFIHWISSVDPRPSYTTYAYDIATKQEIGVISVTGGSRPYLIGAYVQSLMLLLSSSN